MLQKHHTEPGAAGPKWEMPTAQSENYLAYLEELAQQNIDGLMQASKGQNCQLDKVTSSFVMHQMRPEELERIRMSTAHLVKRQQGEKSITVISGECGQGKLNGPVSALYTDNYYSRSEYTSGATEITGRIDAHFKNGVLHGEARVISIDRSDSGAAWRELRYFEMGVYEHGEPVGDHVNVAGNEDGRVVTVTQSLEKDRSRVNTWMNGKPNTRFHNLNGQIDGWMEFASAVLKDSPTCYRAGEQLSGTAYCKQIAPGLERLKRVDTTPGYARVEVIEDLAVDSPPNAAPSSENSTSASGSSRSAVAWTAPPVGFYSWLSPPANAELESANAADYMPGLKSTLDSDVGAALAQFENGERTGDELQLLALTDARSTRVVKLIHRPDGRERLDVWSNAERQFSTVMRNGLNDGYIKYYDPALNELQQCFRDGIEQKSTRHCEKVGF